MKTVIRNHNRNTGIVVSEHKKHVVCIFMDSEGIKLTKVSHDELKETWTDMDYDYTKAAQHLLRAGKTNLGITPAAENILKEIVK